MVTFEALADLNTGDEVNIWVVSHNSAGYGIPSTSFQVKLMQSSDPPFESILSELSSTIHSSEEIGTSLMVEWNVPIIDTKNRHTDFFGNRGDDVASYLIELSKPPWENYTSSVWEVVIVSGNIA